MGKKNGKRKTGLKLLLALVLVLCGVLGFATGKAKTKEQELIKEKASVESTITTEQEKQKELKEETAYRQTTQYIEDLARKLMGLVKKDEILIRDEKEENGN